LRNENAFAFRSGEKTGAFAKYLKSHSGRLLPKNTSEIFPGSHLKTGSSRAFADKRLW